MENKAVENATAKSLAMDKEAQLQTLKVTHPFHAIPFILTYMGRKST